jgi:hypothetical protein
MSMAAEMAVAVAVVHGGCFGGVIVGVIVVVHSGCSGCVSWRA